MKKFNINSKLLEDHYVKNGYVLIRGVFEKKFINTISNFLIKNIKKGENKKLDYHDICNQIMEEFEKMPLYEEILFKKKFKKLLIRFVGQDLCVLNFTTLFLNAPTNKNPVLNKNEHVDVWTGTGVDSIFVKIFFTDCDNYNGLTLYPGTHLHGLYPVKNRGLNLPNDIKLNKKINTSNAKKGDVLMWHPLLIHSTTGRSKKNKRISMTFRFKSTETEFTSQERALGYRTISVGINNKIKRYIGNDYLSPFRIYGGKASIDKRLSKLYNQNYFKKIIKLK